MVMVMMMMMMTSPSPSPPHSPHPSPSVQVVPTVFSVSNKANPHVAIMAFSSSCSLFVALLVAVAVTTCSADNKCDCRLTECKDSKPVAPAPSAKECACDDFNKTHHKAKLLFDKVLCNHSGIFDETKKHEDHCWDAIKKCGVAFEGHTDGKKNATSSECKTFKDDSLHKACSNDDKMCKKLVKDIKDAMYKESDCGHGGAAAVVVRVALVAFAALFALVWSNNRL